MTTVDNQRQYIIVCGVGDMHGLSLLDVCLTYPSCCSCCTASGSSAGTIVSFKPTHDQSLSMEVAMFGFNDGMFLKCNMFQMFEVAEQHTEATNMNYLLMTF